MHETLRDPLLKAARQARDKRQIGLLDFLHIRLASRSDAFLEDAAGLILEEAKADGVPYSAGPNGAINWDALLAFIEKLIPLILQLIKLFSP